MRGSLTSTGLPFARNGRGFLKQAETVAVVTAALFAAGAALAGILLGMDEFLALLGRLSPWLIGGMLALSLVNYGLRAWRWHLFGRKLGVEVPFGRTVLYYAAGFALTTTPGKLGELLRLWLLERGHGYPYQRTTPLFIGDRVGDANAILLLCLAGLGAFGGHVWVTAGALLLVGAGTLLLLKPRLLARPLLLAYGVVGRWPRLFAGVRTSLRHTARFFTPRLYLAALLLGTAGWLAECLAFHMVLEALGAAVSFQQAVFVFAFSMLVGAASMLPGGLGSTEAVMVGLLAAIGVEIHTAVAAAVVIRATTLWFAVGLGLAALPVALGRARRVAVARG
ncbi:lysylphosphatidylglycerol synthase transmembrane domain-containing protein [Azospirillum oleiclasticum]|uniref:Flippase-like domain-containing protein n=1 Tax=Azospirillum oleiclasticum TaxID=2735135 RepID=A0ABX2TM91_9PROT|nr:lysylphosphatidylglycerol synthase transmembrane domain-containing protein [Azospirillum oleiclasticum]NYZ24666.1 flippase-like domain-containing protein [Azospirillum oleiclasticum]